MRSIPSIGRRRGHPHRALCRRRGAGHQRCRERSPPSLATIGGAAARTIPSRPSSNKRAAADIQRTVKARQERGIERGNDDAVERALLIEQLADELHRPTSGQPAEHRAADEQQIIAGGVPRNAEVLPVGDIDAFGGRGARLVAMMLPVRSASEICKVSSRVRPLSRSQAARSKCAGSCARATRSARIVVSIASMCGGCFPRTHASDCANPARPRSRSRCAFATG